jgi:hypothetical protein
MNIGERDMNLSYLDREMTATALSQMKSFEGDLKQLYSNWGLDLREDLGRRNSLISSAQERFFAKVLGERFHDVERDGKSGQPDITIGELGRELECKLTSGSGGSWQLQTDYATLQRKGEVDHLYVLATPEFDRFCVLLFENLTVDDFHPPAPGSRMKSRMHKARAMEKCHVLWGEAENRNVAMLTKLGLERDRILNEQHGRLIGIDLRINEATDRKRPELVGLRDRETQRYGKQMDDVQERVEIWNKSETQWSFKLEELA